MILYPSLLFAVFCGRWLWVGRGWWLCLRVSAVGSFLVCFYHENLWLFCLFFFFLRGHQRPPGGDNAVGITLFCFLFFFLVWALSPPIGENAVGFKLLNYRSWTKFFFSCVVKKAPPAAKMSWGKTKLFFSIFLCGHKGPPSGENAVG